ncbi:MAG: right-handed parallel beta-helix repeat-containing protein [Nitrospira sp.]
MKNGKTTVGNYCMSISLLLACAVPLTVEAKTLYVNRTTGTDAVSYAANSESAPWQTIGRAAWGSTNRSAPNSGEAARAGDVVRIAAGTYSTAGTDNRFDPAYNPANSGTPGNPIIFQAQGAVTLTLSSSRGPVIGANAKNYIMWKGFTINEVNATTHADTGSVTILSSTGSSVENLILDGNGDPGYGDNHPGIRIEHSVGITARNNMVRNYRTSGVNQVNGAGIQVYNSKGLTIEHNEIYNSGSGIFLKAIGFNGDTATPSEYSDMQDVIRYNLIHDVAHGLVHHRHYHSSSTIYVLWYQNIVRDATLGGITLWGFPGDGPSNSRFINNTVDGAVNGIYLKAETLTNNWNNLIQNNLITRSANYSVFNEPATGAASFELDRVTFAENWYWTFPVLLVDSSGNKTLPQLQSTYPGQEVGGTSGVNPSYVNAGGNDFHLSIGSPALTAGRAVLSIGGADGATIPVGAYITGDEVIGLTSGSSDITPPATVQNVRIL